MHHPLMLFIAAIFDESTVSGLRMLSEGKYHQTMHFVDYIIRLWKILNVRTPVKGEQIS